MNGEQGAGSRWLLIAAGTVLGLFALCGMGLLVVRRRRTTAPLPAISGATSTGTRRGVRMPCDGAAVAWDAVPRSGSGG